MLDHAEELGSGSSVAQDANAVVVEKVRQKSDAEGQAEGESDAEGEAEGESDAESHMLKSFWEKLKERMKENRNKEQEEENLALRCSLPPDQMELEDQRPYVKLRGLCSATHFALAGIGAAPDFKVPVDRFRAEDIVGKYLVAVGLNEDGEYTYKRKKATGKVELSDAPVSCFVPTKIEPGQEAAIYSYGCLLQVADADSWVGVKFAYHEEKLPAIERACADVREVRTPETPSSCGSFASR